MQQRVDQQHPDRASSRQDKALFLQAILSGRMDSFRSTLEAQEAAHVQKIAKQKEKASSPSDAETRNPKTEEKTEKESKEDEGGAKDQLTLGEVPLSPAGLLLPSPAFISKVLKYVSLVHLNLCLLYLIRARL